MCAHPHSPRDQESWHSLGKLWDSTRHNPEVRPGTFTITDYATTLKWAPKVLPGPDWNKAQPVILSIPSQVLFYSWACRFFL